MERLTIRNSDGSVSQPTNLKWAEALEKLAAYEDTGLDPEEIARRKEDLHVLDLFKAQSNDAEESIRIAKARREGRFIILPCKVGDTVWDRELEAWNVISIEWFSRKVNQLHCSSPVTGRRHTFSVGKRSLGKTVFLTREEAEKAFEGMNNC